MSVTLTEAAARHVKRYIAKRGKGVGVRLDARTRMVYDGQRVFANGESWRAAGQDARQEQRAHAHVGHHPVDHEGQARRNDGAERGAGRRVNTGDDAGAVQGDRTRRRRHQRPANAATTGANASISASWTTR